jgi:hypothetical protein
MVVKTNHIIDDFSGRSPQKNTAKTTENPYRGEKQDMLNHLGIKESKKRRYTRPIQDLGQLIILVPGIHDFKSGNPYLEK